MLLYCKQPQPLEQMHMCDDNVSIEADVSWHSGRIVLRGNPSEVFIKLRDAQQALDAAGLNDLKLIFDIDRVHDSSEQVVRELAEDLVIDKLNLSARVTSCLKRQGIDTVNTLIALTITDLDVLRSLGGRGVDEIIQRLAVRGLSLSDEETAVSLLTLSSPIISLKVSYRTFNLLRRAGVETIDDLTKLRASRLMAIPNFGAVSLDEVESALTAGGFKLLPEDL